MLDSGIFTPHSHSTTASEWSPRSIRPIGAYALQGLSTWHDRLVTMDTIRGYLLGINPLNDNAMILNPDHTELFIEATGFAIWDETIWFAKGREVYCCPFENFEPQLFTALPYEVDGVGIWESTVYITSQKYGYILIYARDTKRKITQFPLPGVGMTNLTVRDEELWLCDRTEETVYCLDRATGELKFNLLTPFENPTAIAFFNSTLYVAYAGEEAYIRDNPNAEPNLELTYRDRTFIHPLHFRYYPDERYALSNGYLLEMSYVEELLPLDEIELEELEWRIALPAETHRQKIRSVEAIGLPFTEEIQDGQRVAVFKFPKLGFQERHLFGWKAILEVRGIKYQFSFEDVGRVPELTPEFRDRYLVDDDELAMDKPVIQHAAREAIGTETNLLRKMLKIRNYVYDKLSYGIKPHIDSPDVVLDRGVGSCGEYVGVLLALARLNGIACRTVGRYKCPPFADRQNVPLEPDYNHVWIEFYIPEYGWIPMESNPDDIIDRGPYPTRFFMGLPWYHAEISKGISFESLKSRGIPIADLMDLSIGDLALNHIRFTILGELPPLE